MKGKNRNLILIFLLVFLVVNTLVFAIIYRQSLAPSDSGAAGVAKTVLTLASPASVDGVPAGTDITVALSIDNTTGVRAAEIVLNYNPAILQGISINEASGVLALGKNFNSTTGKASVDIANEEATTGTQTFANDSTLVSFVFRKLAGNPVSTTITTDPATTLGVPNQAATTGQGSLILKFITSRCGDNAIQTPNDAGLNEVCDNGSQNGVTCSAAYGSSCQYCNSTCTSLVTVQGPRCGDGSTQSGNGEQCDNGASNGTVCNPAYGSSCTYCNTSCQNVTVQGARCGDGVTQSANGEQCDNGASNGTVCNPAYGSSCNYCNSTCKTTTLQGGTCGDGTKQAQEQCDDGNTANYDSCGSTCQITCATGEVAIAGKCVSVACRGDYDRNGTIAINDFGTLGQNYKKANITCNLDIVIDNGQCYLDIVDFAQFGRLYRNTNACM